MRVREISLVFVLSVYPLVAASAVGAAQPDRCDVTSTGLVPLPDLGANLYAGEQGGLYPDGSNDIPGAHERLGLELARQVVPRDAVGSPDVDGAIGLLSIGVSNTHIEFEEFVELASQTEGLNSSVTMVDGAQGGRAIHEWVSQDAETWKTVAMRVERAGLTPAQIQVAWVKLPQVRVDRQAGFVADQTSYAQDLGVVLQHLTDQYPNLRIAYLSNRIYAGYAGNRGEPETYENGFGVKWTIEGQVDGGGDLNPDPNEGTVEAPWIAWGPYLWADGPNPRADGLAWKCEDLQTDGIHPSAMGAEKVAGLLLDFFTTEPTARWFLDGQGAPVDGATGGENAAATTTSTTMSPAVTSSTQSPTTSVVGGGSEGEPLEETIATEVPRTTNADSVSLVLALSIVFGMGLVGGLTFAYGRWSQAGRDL